MKHFLTALLCAFALLSCSKEPTRVLVLYENSGHHKDFTDAIVPWLKGIAPEKNLSITEINSPDAITGEEYLDDFDVILQLDYPPYMWNEASLGALSSFLDEGKGGWVGLHHASLLGEFDGYEMVPWFYELLGGIRYMDYIAELSDGKVVVEKPAHPIFKGLPTEFVIKDDEWYTYDRSPRLNPAVEVLAIVDEDSYTSTTNKKMGDHPVIWTNTSKLGRNVYFQFGHSKKLVDDDNFKTLILNAIQWAGEN